MNTSAGEDERRTSRRVPISLRCWLVSESLTLLASTLNVSEGGALVTAPLRLPVGRLVDIAIAFENEDLTTSCLVVRSTASSRRGGAELGLKFLSPQATLVEHLCCAKQ